MAPLALGVGWLLGIVAGPWFALPLHSALGLAGGALIAAFPFRRTPAISLACLLVAGTFGATARLAAVPPPPDLGRWIGQSVLLDGVVAEEPVRRGESNVFRFHVAAIQAADDEWTPVGADVLVRVDPFVVVRPGDLLLLRGRLDEPWQPDGNSYREYLARLGMHAELGFPEIVVLGSESAAPEQRLLPRLRRALSDALLRSLPEPSAALAQGILLGERGGFSTELADAFQRTGTTHLIAISGFNISLVIGFVRPLGTLIVGRRDWIVVLPAIAGYVALIGPQPSVVRAAIMGSLAVIARTIGRPADGLAWLSLAAIAMTAASPATVADLGFQLSFAATLGLIVLADPIARRLQFTGRWLSQQVACTVAAECAVAPLLIHGFGAVSVVTLAANLLAAELVAPGMVLSAFTAGIGAVSPPLAEVPSWFTWLVLHVFVTIVVGLGSVPFALLHVGEVPDWLTAGLAVPLFGAILVRRDLPFRAHLVALAELAQQWGRGRLPALPTGGLVGSLAAVAVLTWAGAVVAPTPAASRLTVLDLGSGEALLLQTHDGLTVLIDGGGNATALVNAVDRRIPFWRRQIDLAILTSPDDNRLAGLIELGERNRLREVLQPRWDLTTPAVDRWQTVVEEHGITVTEAQHGQVVRVGDDVRLTVLLVERPVEANAPSAEAPLTTIALRLDVGPTSALLLGDADNLVQRWIAATQEPVDLITVPRSGRRGSLGSSLVQAVRPGAALISIPARQGYRYPDPETLAQLDGITVYRTDAHGSIEVDFAVDGYDVRTQRDGSAR